MKMTKEEQGVKKKQQQSSNVKNDNSYTEDDADDDNGDWYNSIPCQTGKEEEDERAQLADLWAQ